MFGGQARVCSSDGCRGTAPASLEKEWSSRRAGRKVDAVVASMFRSGMQSTAARCGGPCATTTPSTSSLVLTHQRFRNAAHEIPVPLRSWGGPLPTARIRARPLRRVTGDHGSPLDSAFRGLNPRQCPRRAALLPRPASPSRAALEACQSSADEIRSYAVPNASRSPTLSLRASCTGTQSRYLHRGGWSASKGHIAGSEGQLTMAPSSSLFARWPTLVRTTTYDSFPGPSISDASLLARLQTLWMQPAFCGPPS